jgi:hypothetical protein
VRVGGYGVFVDDCGESVWGAGCIWGDVEAFEKRGDVWVGYPGLGVGDAFEVENGAYFESVWGPGF